MAQEQRGVELLFSGLKLLSSSFQMHASYQRTSHKLPRCESVQRKEQATTYRSLYEPNKVTPLPRSYTWFYPKSPKPRTINALKEPIQDIYELYTCQILSDNYHKTNFSSCTVIYQGTPTSRIQYSRKLCSIKYNRPALIPKITNQQCTSIWDFEILNHWQLKSNRLMQELPLDVISYILY